MQHAVRTQKFSDYLPVLLIPDLVEPTTQVSLGQVYSMTNADNLAGMTLGVFRDVDR
jgi:hypothetical protein